MELDLKSHSFRISLAVDSSDIIYRLKIETDGPLANELAIKACEKLREKSVKDAYLFSSKELSNGHCAGPLEDELLYHLKLLLKRYAGSDHTSSETRGFSPNELICRCESIDESAMKKAFEEERGNYKEAVLKSNAGMICSSCRKDLKALYNSMTFEDIEERKKRVKAAVESSLSEFLIMCPPEYGKLEFEVSNIKEEKIKIKASGERNGLGRNQIKKTLENFIGKDALEGMVISVFY